MYNALANYYLTRRMGEKKGEEDMWKVNIGGTDYYFYLIHYMTASTNADSYKISTFTILSSKLLGVDATTLSDIFSGMYDCYDVANFSDNDVVTNIFTLAYDNLDGLTLNENPITSIDSYGVTCLYNGEYINS